MTKVIKLAAEPLERAMLVPFIPKPVWKVEEKQESLIPLIEKMPSVKKFISFGTPSLRKSCFLETEIVFGARAIQQLYLLKALNILLIKDMNQKVMKVKD